MVYVKYFLVRLLRVILIFFGLLLIISLFLITYVDRTPPEETTYYKTSIDSIKSFEYQEDTVPDSIRVGWSRISITPERVLPLAGYGARPDKRYKSIHDSIFVRTLVFEDGENLSAIVNLDLLIVPPEVIKALKRYKLPDGFSQKNLFFTATHSHSSIGAWQPGFVGDLFAGEYDTAVVNNLAQKIAESLFKAQKNIEKARFGFIKVDNADLVRNRLVGEKGIVDPWLRIIKIEKQSGDIGYFVTYSAHATCLSHHYNDLSADYPGELTRILSSDPTIDFAAYAAGAVASMSSQAPGLKGFEKVNFVAENLANQVNLIGNLIETSSVNDIEVNHFKVDLGAPQFKISESLKLRSWVFRKVFGDYELKVSSLKLGDILFVGMPCDFSGELSVPLDSIAEKHHLNLMITSFNGGYAGYVTKDEWYDLPKYETRTMNWYGPGNGDYFSEITKILIEKHANH